MALPTAWNAEEKSAFLSVDSEGLRVNYIGPNKSNQDAARIRANHPLLPKHGMFYFEVNIVNIGEDGEDGMIGIGFCARTVDLNKMTGWEDDSWSYRDNGDISCHSTFGWSYGPSFTTGDTIGCYVNFLCKVVFYTINGVHLGIAFRWLEGDLYPSVGLKSKGASVEVNFGHRKFKYEAMNDDDIDSGLLKEKWNKVFFQRDNKLSNQPIDRFEELTGSLVIKQDDELSLKYQVKVFFIMGKYEDALVNLTKLLEIRQDDEFALRYRGEIYYMMESYEESLQDFKKLLEINPKNTWALKSLKEVNRRKDLNNADDHAIATVTLHEEGAKDPTDYNIDNSEFAADYLRRKIRFHLRGWRNICIKRLESEFNTWTSGNKMIDDFIRKKQFKASQYTDLIEWIPFCKFQDVKHLAKGGFGSVYTATWTDGYISSWDFSEKRWIRRDKNKTYCLKTLDNETGDVEKFLQEIENQLKFRGELAISMYGITKDPENNYMMVMQYAEEGSLRRMLDKRYNTLNWKSKVETLFRIVQCLEKIHDAKLVHKDFHSGNIVMQDSIRPYITDFGLCKPITQDSTSKVYGVVPYVAPEVLTGKKYTASSDIYSFGIIMSEVLSGYPPYHDIPHDIYLVMRIIEGERPKIRCQVPRLLKDLMNRCLDSDPLNRPSTKELYEYFYLYYNSLKFGMDSEIVKQVQAIKEVPEYDPSKSSPLDYITHSSACYTSRLINPKKPDKPVNNTEDSQLIDFEIPEDFDE